MEFAQFHSFERQSTAGIAAALRQILKPGYLHRRADVGVVVNGPWRPADLWSGGIERLVWSVGVDAGGGPLLSERGEAALGHEGATRRQAPVHPVESLAQRAGEGLVIVHSDAACFAYAAVYRQRRLAWSLFLQDRVKLVRCDGEVVQVAEPPRYVPEGDRTGVLLAGLQQWLREPIVLQGDEHYTLADTLAQLTSDEAPEWIVRDGHFPTPPAESGRARASG